MGPNASWCGLTSWRGRLGCTGLVGWYRGTHPCSIVFNYFVWVTFCPSPLILGVGALKAITRRFKIAWTFAFEVLAGFVYLLSTAAMLYDQYYIHPNATWDILALWSGVFSLYGAFTYISQPEVTGARTWPVKHTL